MKSLITLIKNLLVATGHFGHCYNRGHCDGITYKGVCLKCHGGKVCMHCDDVKQKDGSWLSVPHLRDSSSHGICKECLIIHYGEFGKEIERRHREGQDCHTAADRTDRTQKIFIERNEMCHA